MGEPENHQPLAAPREAAAAPAPQRESEPVAPSSEAAPSEVSPAEGGRSLREGGEGLREGGEQGQPGRGRPGPTRQRPAYTDKEVRRLNRRELLKLTPLVLAGAFVVPKLRTDLLQIGVAATDQASDALFRRAHLAQTFPDSMVVPFDKFPYNGYDVLDPEVELENWTLTVEGQVTRPDEYALAQIQQLPKVIENTRHICVEGWDVVGSFGGARVSDFFKLIGADTSARYVEVECADDYYESIDMASVLHPQSLLCYEMYGKPLDRGHGAPLRLRLPTKLGYKSAKYLTTLRVTNVLRPGKRGYWEDQGYAWYAGL